MPLKHRRVLIASAVVVGVAAAAVGATVWARDVDADDGTARPQQNVKTVAVTRQDLSTSRTLRGSLGFGTPRPVKSGREGVVTWLPQPGTSVARGEVLYRLNDEAVPLFTGSPPLYRPLAARGTVGRDVAMVAENLKALGYPIGTQPKAGERVTQEAPPPNPGASGAPATPPGATSVTVKAGEGAYTAALINAVKKWQRDRGLPDDGRLDVGDLAVLPGPVRVDSVSALVGDAATGTLMSVTSTTKVVTVQAPPAEVDALREGDATSVRLPDGATAAGKVSAIATVAQQNEAGGTGPQTVAVTVALDDPGAAGHLDGADVTVEVAGETRKGVLAVPVNALLALSEGGYAVQLEDGRLIGVRTGLFSRGLVEIEGTGVVAGLKVVTTS
ncbi:efflux RND transporter periplasmic adaptor subunit [Virgisporangium aliadipatigenens]|nr:efflux RND transporter periplasmic adaptor subunit [Virgisporangium aliadipatigenens]